VINFRFHDSRHDLGTKPLRLTGNLKLVQRALNHSDIKTTMRYAHVLDEEVGDAVEKLAKSRSKSRTAFLLFCLRDPFHICGACSFALRKFDAIGTPAAFGAAFATFLAVVMVANLVYGHFEVSHRRWLSGGRNKSASNRFANRLSAPESGAPLSASSMTA
jgi:hypothetical protein